jgi:hypothetical protein
MGPEPGFEQSKLNFDVSAKTEQISIDTPALSGVNCRSQNEAGRLVLQHIADPGPSTFFTKDDDHDHA